MKKIITLSIAFIAAFTFISSSAFAQEKTSPKKKEIKIVKGVDVVKSRGAENPNIKTTIPTTDVPAAKTRGNCSVDFENETGLFINVYVDGSFRGTLSPYGSGNVTVGEGYTTIYCQSSGQTREWSASGNCSEEYVYTLR